jgi:hypothetical protein
MNVRGRLVPLLLGVVLPGVLLPGVLWPGTLRAADKPPVGFISYADQFDRFEARTRAMAPAQRVTDFKEYFGHIRPGLYAGNAGELDRRIARALAEFPALRERYRVVEQRFPDALATAVGHFRAEFESFEPPLPIILAHELGMRDGGTDYVAGTKVMLFGADMIARLHDDDSLQPFLTHELFHLEHARHFADCDQLWCPLWQEGLATFAAAHMTPGATDHQLLLDAPLRSATDAHWNQAICLLAQQFDSTEPAATANAFLGGQHPPELPSRFGYYVGLRLATELARTQSLVQLAQLGNEQARPLVVLALRALLAEAHAGCPAPPANGPITHADPRPA